MHSMATGEMSTVAGGGGEPGNRDSIRYTNHTKNVSESMDFEEMESVMWRKVSLLDCYLLRS